ncbi:MAG: phenylalanine--tRNA ligase subunit beta [Victivallales bacterium]|nr:phenylalanine--tRNA ligase subunit beta [Victivallales bacterium]
MNISYNWLAQYVDTRSCNVATLCDKLTRAGIEVEAVQRQKLAPDGIVVAEILERKPHPNADKLSVCRVSDGKAELQIVCGAPNCDAGKKVPLATIGTVFTDPETGKEFTIKKSNLRGEKSSGMLCSAAELGVNSDASGLLELPTDLTPGTSLHDVYSGDTVIEVEVTPNRPDWLSHWGIARDVSCLLDAPAKMPEISLPEPAGQAAAKLVTVEAEDLCPRYTARIIRNVKIQDSPDWLKERLLSIGLRPINNVVDITNFVLHELGQPLHAFDLARLAGKRIVVRRAKNGERMTLLDNTELKLTPHHLVICDAEKPSCLGGVMGGLDSGVTAETTDILLEAAYFKPSNIRATARELGLSSDSSYRFERGIDWDMVPIASDRAAALILELAGGDLGSELVDVRGEPPRTAQIRCRFEKIRKLIGIEIPNTEIIAIFRKLQLQVDHAGNEQCTVTPPRFRLDLEREADLAEEVARICGLDAVPVKPVTGKAAAPFAADAYREEEKLRAQLISLGLYECMHYSMVNEQKALKDTRFTPDSLLRISNPLSQELACMRPSLFGEMLATVERNAARRNLNLRLFELGNVFCADPRLFPEERREICIVLSGRKLPERFSAELEELYDFYDLKGLLEALLEMRSVENYGFEKAEDGRFAPGHCAALLIDGEIAGQFGLLASEHTQGFRTEFPVYLAILDAGLLLRRQIASRFYRPLSVYPAITRDVAFVADQALEHQTVIRFIENARLKNFETVKLFDIFTDDQAIGAGRKSMAYTLTFRNPEQTLTDEEVNRACEKLRRRMEAQLGVELR